MRSLVSLVLLLSLSGPASAARNPTAAVLAKLAQRDPGAYAYFAGLGQGISHANAFLSMDKRTLLYCPPREMPLGAGEYETILREFVRLHPSEDDAEVGLMLIFALQDKFPCSP